jgi:hypothetical protein
MQSLADSGELEAALEVFMRETVNMLGQQHIAMDIDHELFSREVGNFLSKACPLCTRKGVF